MESKNKPVISLKDLMDIKEWQKIQDNFSTITEVTLRTLDSKGNPLTRISREPRLCSTLLDDSPLKSNVCFSCLPTFLGGKGVVNRNLTYICEAGLYNLVAPLRFEGQVFGYLIIGPVILVMRKPKEAYRKVAEELGMDMDDFWNAILEIKVISFQGIQSLVELIKEIGEYTIKLAYQGLRKEEQKTMAFDSPELTRTMEVLLDVAFQVTEADLGSIMLYDKNEKKLTIRTSRGIADEIVRSAKVNLGEGVSGIAAKERVPFLIDDNQRDNRLKGYLNRPYIGSSMVLPIEVEDSLCGVINLGALRTSPVRFNDGNVQLMKKLIDLATCAIPPIS